MCIEGVESADDNDVLRGEHSINTGVKSHISTDGHLSPDKTISSNAKLVAFWTPAGTLKMANPLLLLFQTLLSTVVGALAAPALPNYASICRIKQSSDGAICQCSPEINQLEINNQTLIQILQENQRQEKKIDSPTY